MPGQSYEEMLAVLQEEYSSYLESSVVAAILLDHDSLEGAREVLDLLKEATPLDDSNGISGNGDHGENGSGSDWGNNYCNFGGEGETPATSVSVRSNEDELPPSSGEGTDADAKMSQLAVMFPMLSAFTLRHTLDKCQGDVDKAVDELLNRCFLDEAGEGGKGIDGFAEEMMLSLPATGKKRKGRGKKRGGGGGGKGFASWETPPSPLSPDWSDSGSNRDGGSSSGKPVKSKWADVGEEVAYLSAALHLPKRAVASVYHESGSMTAAILPLVKAHGKCEQLPEDAEHLENMHELASLFPRIPSDLINGVLKLCQGDVAVAAELCPHILRSFIQDLQPAPPLPPALAANGNSTAKKQTAATAWKAVERRKDGSTSPLSPTSPVPLHVARDAANGHLLARNEAYDKAHTAYRRSKSDKLMGAVATYYADVGRAHDGRVKSLNHAAAEALVDENVNTVRGQVLDLHGVTVQQGVRIAREKVTEWWVGYGRTYGEDMLMKGPERGGVTVKPFRIITGKGMHSRNGETKLGPAVARSLIKENWRIEVRDGFITVLGVARRK